MVTEKQPNPAMAFVLDALKQNNSVSYAEVKEAGMARGFTIQPVTYGFAKRLLGLVASKPRAKRTASPKAKAQGASRVPPSPRTGRSSIDDPLQATMQSLRELVQERDQLRDLLMAIQQLVKDVR